jgi:penicillin-binding protein 2
MSARSATTTCEALEDPDPLLQIPKFQIGKIGVEADGGHLRGSAGTKRIEVNAAGRVMRELDRRKASRHRHPLTIDADVQNFVQARLGEESAAAVVMDVTNGDSSAIASSPSFDPNLFVRGISHPTTAADRRTTTARWPTRRCRAPIRPARPSRWSPRWRRWRPGSSRPTPGLAAPASSSSAGGGSTAGSAAGTGTVEPGPQPRRKLRRLLLRHRAAVGIDKIAEMGRKLGLGHAHDLPMSAVTRGMMPDKAWKQERHEDWRIGDTINASIGQGYVLTSPLQLAVMTARLATGRAVVPRLVHGRSTGRCRCPRRRRWR